MTGPSSPIGQWLQTSRRLVKDASAIVLHANKQINKGTFGSAQWAQSVYQLANLGLTASLELAPPMMPSPCLLGSGELELSDFNQVEQPDNECERVLSVAQSFALDGAPSCRIPDQFIVFVPDILRVNAVWFRVGVRWPELRSGTYRGRVRLTQIQTGAKRVDEMDVIVDL
jgi:hypothetical protein